MQDDFQDCYGDPQVTGKIGTDIQDNKCSWVAVECLRRADDKQKQILFECYGKQGMLCCVYVYKQRRFIRRYTQRKVIFEEVPFNAMN